MCGIVGIVARKPEEDLRRWLDGMNAIQFHRGPDSGGVFVDPDVGLALGMRRLAIIDAEGGLQPMRSGDSRHTLVYNGEIMNAPELRRQLEARGEVFATDHSDTEVLLALLRHYGIAGLERLNGMFAFALYDAKTRTVTLGRDRFGIKPLYFTRKYGTFAFASEMKSLLQLPFVTRDVNTQALHHYLSLMYVSGAPAIIDGIERLGAGQALVYHLSSGSLDITTWWRPRFEADPSLDARELPNLIRDSLRKAVRRWSLADVPVACSLSGGLDSSAIVGALSEAGQPPATFSLGFAGDREEQWNELPLAAAVSRKWGTEHHELVMKPADLLNDLGKMVWHMDEPYGGGLPSWAVFKHMSQSVKVGMVGSGGDELFGNYGKWIGLERRFPWLGEPDVSLERFRSRFFESFYYFPDHEKQRVTRGSGSLEDTASLLYHHYKSAHGRIRDRCATTDIETQLADEFLAMTDRFSMAHSLEARPPFLDNELFDLVRRIPPSIRTARRDLKGLLRQAVAPLLPVELLNAPKKGFVIPLKLWLRGELRSLVEQALSPDRLRRQGIFEPSLYERHVKPHLDGEADLTTRVWGLLMFQLWHRQFVEGTAAGVPRDMNDLRDAFRDAA
jgi:asparagine synthase (glutamine-hydrolysing)